MRSIEDLQRQDLWTKDNDFPALARMLLRTKTTGAPGTKPIPSP
jgi:hypothetical protein